MSYAINPEILLYHRVAADDIDNQYLSVHPDNFEEHLDVLSKERKVVPLFDMVSVAQKGRLITDGVAITFDDGYADNLLNALPLLEKYKCHATIFVTAGLLGNAYGFWYDVLEDIFFSGKALPSSVSLPMVGEKIAIGSPEEALAVHEMLLTLCKKAAPRVRRLLLHEIVKGFGIDPLTYTTSHPLLEREQLRELAKSPWIEIGSHTLTHPVLSGLSEHEQKHEIYESMRILTEITGKQVRILAYPFGNPTAYNATTCRIMEEAGLLGIANIQGNISLPLNVRNVPRRLVRNWNGRQFHNWLHSTNKDTWENTILAGREQKLLSALQNNAAFIAPAVTRACVHTSKNTLKIAHINTSIGKGGAAGVMQLLREMQNSAGHDSSMLAGIMNVGMDGGRVFDSVPDASRAAETKNNGLLDYHLQGSHLLNAFPQVRQADVVHLHNLHGGYFNPWSLPGIARLHPTVWTLHDMQALTGHCAHAFECTRWQNGCGLCPHLDVYVNVPVDNTHRMWRDKQCIYSCSPMHIVTPSQWLGNFVKKSILQEHKLTVIPNGIDTKIFTPQDKVALREKFGIPQDALVVGSAAHGGPLNNIWKGGNFALEAFQALTAKFPNVLFLGRGNERQVTMPHMYLLPYAHSEKEMAEFYSMLDFMLYPSLADNCPLVVLEAMACGVPVLAFSVGGIPELIDDDCGMLVEARDSNALCQAALTLAGDAELRQRMGQHARRKAEMCFDARLMAQRYEDVYADVICTWQSMPQMGNTLSLCEKQPLINTPAFEKMAKQSRLFHGTSQKFDDKKYGMEPVSRKFGLDRGTAIDRVYIEEFLQAHKKFIHGRVLEIGDNTYTKKFGSGVSKSDVLNVVPCEGATIIGSLEDADFLQKESFDCIIFTQALHLIYNTRNVLKNLGRALAAGGCLLLTAPCISQISRYDMDRWGDYWRFTDKGLHDILSECIHDVNITVEARGNLAIAKAFLEGKAAEEVPRNLFKSDDSDYQVMLLVCVYKTLE